MTRATSSTFGSVGRLLVAGLVLIVVGGLAVLGWRWQANVTVSHVEVTGASHAAADSLASLARIEPGTALFDIDPALVADRVQRHPWVRSASVTRLPTGTLRISVEERVPVALLVGQGGELDLFLDAHGFQMPALDSAVYDVPVITGLDVPYEPLHPIRDAAAIELLSALSEGRAVRLLSELALSGTEVTAYTLASDPHGVIPVRLGHGDIKQKMTHLDAFWEQAVRTQPDKIFEVIDLRFEGQVVTRENAPGQDGAAGDYGTIQEF